MTDRFSTLSGNARSSGSLEFAKADLGRRSCLNAPGPPNRVVTHSAPARIARGPALLALSHATPQSIGPELRA
jgi:hypothetical protein